MWFRRQPAIEFRCAVEDEGVIPPPVPAKSHLPAWFKKLAPVDKTVLGAASNGQTVKRCMPFLDAMTSGWILPLPASVRLEVTEGGRKVAFGWEFDKVVVSEHQTWQVEGHPLHPRQPLKFHNYWVIRTPPGWSCLFLPPVNRPHPALEIVAGVVDTDRYHGYINFPFFVTGPDGLYAFEKGMPLVQVIPFPRAALQEEAVIRAETEAEAATRHKILRNTMAGEGWYRCAARAPRS